MNIWDIVIIVIVIGGAVFALIRSKKRKGGCHGSCCEGCTCKCDEKTRRG